MLRAIAADEPRAEEEPAEETWTDSLNAEEQAIVSPESPIGRRDDENGLNQGSEQEDRQDDEQQSLASTATSNPAIDRTMFH
ncbi:MAG: hypothetical protein ABJF89_10740 [Parasphingorhabdus sp.]|uniref:hypothetical protein n=1 Tax=Parasphingorhabdus sp. TaxID=2709688 RepID=UPI003262D8AB